MTVITITMPIEERDSELERLREGERLRAENDRLRDAVIDCLSWMQCYCGNPYCGKCRATREADAALAAMSRLGHS